MSPALDLAPAWVEPSILEPGSTDPLGYREKRDRLAETIVPGITVNTWEPGYVSFLCWAMERSDGDARSIDAWERALTVSEHFRHLEGTHSHRFFGSRIVGERDPSPRGLVPSRLHQVTARTLFSGLLQSLGFTESTGVLTPIGSRLAALYQSRAPRFRAPPTTVSRARQLPCLQDLRAPERGLVIRQLFEGLHGERRHEVRQKLGRRGWMLARSDRGSLMRWFLRLDESASPLDATLRRAAVLELEAIPLEQLFLWFYRNRGLPKAARPASGRRRLFRVRSEDFRELLADVRFHLLALQRECPERRLPTDLGQLRDTLYRQHVNKKGGAAWVDSEWRPLRSGLGSDRDEPGLYRLGVFATFCEGLGL